MRKIQQQNVSTERKDEDKHKRKQKDQSRALAIIILTLFLSFFPHAPRHLACCCCPSSLSYFYESSRSVDRVLNCGFWVVVTTVEPAPLPRRRGRGPSSSLLLQLLLWLLWHLSWLKLYYGYIAQEPKLTQALLYGDTKCRWSGTHAMIGKMRWLQNRGHWWFQMQEDVVAHEAVTQTSGQESVTGTRHAVSSNVATAGHGRGYI
jgi:hypothetical protein